MAGGLIEKIKKATGLQRYSTDEIVELSKDAAELSPEKRAALLDAAISKLEKHAPKDNSFKEQAAVLNDPKTQNLAGAIMRMDEYSNDRQAARIVSLSSAHDSLKTVMHEQFNAIQDEAKLLRGLDERPRSHSR